jgi:CBS domain containing-hemolysin-like protein
MSYSTLNRIKLKNLAQKSKRARLVLKMLEVYDKILSTVLIGNNIVNIAASALAAALFIELFGPKGVSIATLIMTVLVLVVGDISPKALAKETPELTAIRNAPLLNLFVFVLMPINFLMSGWKKVLLKLFPVKTDRSTTEDELLTYVEEVRHEGVINIHEEKMIRQVISFDDMKVTGIFTPRVDVVAVSEAAGIEEIDKIFIETGYSRLPVYKDTIDNITGVILLKDFYHKAMKGLMTPRQIIKPVVYVTKTIKIARLLRTLQEKKSHFAVVVDEHGGTMGIITIEDILEELVGEIWDEHDEVVEPVKKSDNSFIVLGSVGFSDMLKAIEYNPSPDEDSAPDTTIANWIMETLGRLPKANESLNWNSLTISVFKVIKHRVMEVRITSAINEENKSGGNES